MLDESPLQLETEDLMEEKKAKYGIQSYETSEPIWLFFVYYVINEWAKGCIV